MAKKNVFWICKWDRDFEDYDTFGMCDSYEEAHEAVERIHSREIAIQDRFGKSLDTERWFIVSDEGLIYL